MHHTARYKRTQCMTHPLVLFENRNQSIVYVNCDSAQNVENTRKNGRFN